MKTTEERLKGVYSIMRKDDDWKAAGYLAVPEFLVEGVRGIMPIKDDTDNVTLSVFFLREIPNWLRTEIPIQHLVDLQNDSIVPWRLEEDGFTIKESGGAQLIMKSPIHERHGKVGVTVVFDNLTKEAFVTLHIGAVSFPFQGCKTYTDLLTLIRLIG